jgi:hypothetical protein
VRPDALQASSQFPGRLSSIIFLIRRVITAASSPRSNVIIKQPVKLILHGHTPGAGLVWND